MDIFIIISRFSVDGILNLMKAHTVGHKFGIKGATHGDDFNYVFRYLNELTVVCFVLKPLLFYPI